MTKLVREKPRVNHIVGVFDQIFKQNDGQGAEVLERRV
jgi:hypothetical protein